MASLASFKQAACSSGRVFLPHGGLCGVLHYVSMRKLRVVVLEGGGAVIVAKLGPPEIHGHESLVAEA